MAIYLCEGCGSEMKNFTRCKSCKGAFCNDAYNHRIIEITYEDGTRWKDKNF